MNKKKILIIVLTCILLTAVCVGATYAIWGKTATADKPANVGSASWNESVKYLTFAKVYKNGNPSEVQIGWSVIGMKISVPKAITIPKEYKENKDSASYPVIEIASKFSNISGIKTIILPNTIKTISNNAFALFSDLNTVTVESGANFTIGSNAFNACAELLEFNYSGSTIISIGADAFMGCSKLATTPSV